MFQVNKELAKRNEILKIENEKEIEKYENLKNSITTLGGLFEDIFSSITNYPDFNEVSAF